MAMFLLDAYLHRIGLPGVHKPSLETLQRLHAAHPAAIPFENLNPLLGWPVKLDADSLVDKLITQRRGGWCFEQNALFTMALEALGFRVTPLGARVLWNAPADAPVSARTHMLLQVEAEGRLYLADVGFGGNTLTAPLEWRAHVEQATPHGVFRLTEDECGFRLEAGVSGEWKPLYRFTAERQYPADYAQANWFLCTNPASFFRTTLVAARALPQCRYALRNNELAIHTPAGTEKRIIPNTAELRQCLADEIGIALPEGPELDAALAKLF
jgi:N-hydroxyarylamine O-acetyltransferase